MTFDELIERAIYQSAKKAGQSEDLADNLLRWFQQVSRGDESLAELDSNRRHSETLYDATTVHSRVDEDLT